jgi:hypothetical protein
MSGRLKTAYLPIFAALLAVLLLTGCSKLSDAIGNVKDTASPITATDAPEPSSSPSPESGENPVFGFLGGFISDYRAASDGLFDAVFESEDAGLKSMLLALRSDEALAASLRATAGMLPVGGDSWLFGGSVTGPYAGTGSMNANGSFTYSFEDGGSVSGRFDEGAGLSARIVSNGVSRELRLSAAEGAWLLFVKSEESADYLEIKGGALRFVSLGADDPAAHDPAVFPDTEGALVFETGALR